MLGVQLRDEDLAALIRRHKARRAGRGRSQQGGRRSNRSKGHGSGARPAHVPPLSMRMKDFSSDTPLNWLPPPSDVNEYAWRRCTNVAMYVRPPLTMLPFRALRVVHQVA